MKQYQRKIEVQLEKERLLAKQLLQEGKKEYKLIPFCSFLISVLFV